MAIENVQQLLTEQLGKNGGTEIFTTADQTSKDWYCVYFPVESVIPAFYAIFGFIAYCAIVWAAVGLRELISREEDYYD